MPAIILDGKKVRDKKMIELKQEVEFLAKKGKTPHLAVVQIGDVVASNIYVKNKQNACIKLGIKFTKIALPETIQFVDLKREIQKLNNNQDVDGILIQFPVPSHLSKENIITLISPSKDADGVHPLNQGKHLTMSKTKAPIACTPNGILTLLKEYNIDLDGKNALVFGRSNIVGRPITYLLSNLNASVFQAHSKTSRETVKSFLKEADIIIAATGVRNLFSESEVKKGVVIIDVGISRDSDNKITGDVDYEKFLDVASYITPVPGGVGPMTVTMLMFNVILLAENHLNKSI